VAYIGFCYKTCRDIITMNMMKNFLKCDLQHWFPIRCFSMSFDPHKCCFWVRFHQRQKR